MGRSFFSLTLAALETSAHYILGFTAIVNKQLSAKYETLVSRAPELIKVLPWGPDFEVDVFIKPDFVSDFSSAYNITRTNLRE